VGLRGAQTGGMQRAQPKNSRPNAKMRALRAQQRIEDESPQWWDLVLGDCRYWDDSLCEARRQAWFATRERLLTRWPPVHGRRLDGWICFELPELLLQLVADGVITQEQAERMPDAEAIWWTAGQVEREQIMEGWREDVLNCIRCNPKMDLAGLKRHATDPEAWAIPEWVYDREAGRCLVSTTVLRRVC
jgi:hypothetical protein